MQLSDFGKSTQAEHASAQPSNSTVPPKADDQQELDQALIRLVHVVKASGNQLDMDALGTMLAYMDSLEHQQAKTKSQGIKDIWVQDPVTFTV